MKSPDTPSDRRGAPVDGQDICPVRVRTRASAGAVACRVLHGGGRTAAGHGSRDRGAPDCGWGRGQCAEATARAASVSTASATLLLNQGVDLVVLKELSGHAHIGVTAGAYAHVRLRLQRQAIGTLGRTLGPDPRPPEVRDTGLLSRRNRSFARAEISTLSDIKLVGVAPRQQLELEGVPEVWAPTDRAPGSL